MEQIVEAAPAAAQDDRDRRRARAPARRSAALHAVAGGILGALPVAWVLGAVPWRTPTLLIEQMFRGFSACALDGGALTPWTMVCADAGVPLGMHQLDGGLSYPLSGVLVGLGVDALPAWKTGVAPLLVPGMAALWWLARRLTGSALAASVVVVSFGAGGALTARTWNWYWNTVAVALLPLVFATAYALLDRARTRRPRALLWPAAAAIAVPIAIGIEWSYAGLFATAVSAGAAMAVATLRGWRPLERLAILGALSAGLVAVFAVTRARLHVAGVTEQFGGSVRNAVANSVDLAALVLPDPATSLSGRALDGLGLDRLLITGVSDGNQLWVAPYLGVATLVVAAALAGVRRDRSPITDRVPERFLPLVVCIAAGSLLLALGPEMALAGTAAPDARFAAPTAPLWSLTPLRWIRYPWTWSHLTQLALLIALAALVPMIGRRPRGWSPLVVVLAGVALLDFVSPGVLSALGSPQPSVSTAPHWVRVSSADPAVATFEATAIPELHRALGAQDGIATVLPWGNTWAVPHLGPQVGIPLRNVGIDRNVRQVQQAAPIPKLELRDPSARTVARMLDLGWTDAVALLDHGPTGRAIELAARGRPRPADRAWQRRSAALQDRLRGWGYCVERHSWFALVTRCARTPDS